MLSSITRFEFRYHLTSPVFIAVFAIFFLLTFGAVTIDQIQIGSTNAVNVNSPHAIMQTVLIWSLFGMFIPTAFLVSGILRDSAFKTEELFYTTRVKERDYLLGRFLGGFIITVLAFSSVPLAIMLGASMPWLDPESIGPFVPGHYAYAFFVFGVPNLLVTGLIMFTVANLSRSNLLTYFTLVALLIIYFIGNAALQNPEFRDFIALADPFAVNAYFEAVRYFTAAERNTILPALEDNLLLNRLIWLGTAVGLFILNLAVFRFRRGGFKLFQRKGATNEPAFRAEQIELPRSTPNTGGCFGPSAIWCPCLV